MNETIDKFVNDMRKILEFEKSYGKMEYTQQMSSSKLIVHAFENELIKTSFNKYKFLFQDATEFI